MRGRNQHLCFTSHKEVLCRDYSDYATLFNCIAQGIINTNSKFLSYSIMSNYVHLGAITDKSSGLIQRIRSSYTQMFNHKYGRKGQLGDPSYFQLNLEGRLHIAACLSYISRNAWHHGYAPILSITLSHLPICTSRRVPPSCRVRNLRRMPPEEPDW